MSAVPNQPHSEGFLSRYFQAAGNVWNKLNDKQWNDVNMTLDNVIRSGAAMALPFVMINEVNKESRRLKGAESHIS